MKKLKRQNRLTLEEKEHILSKPVLRLTDIKKLTGYANTTAYQIMRECKEKYNGTVTTRNDAIKTESLFKFLGTSLERELYLLGCAKGYNINFNKKEIE